MDHAYSSVLDEPVIDPDLPIIDAHHHLWFQTARAADALVDDRELGPLQRNFTRHPRYLFDELLADATSGHNVRASIYVEAHSMYRQDGPEWLRPVGEIEFANGMAAMAASGTFGDVRLCAAIVGGLDLRQADRVRPLLEAQIQAGGGRFRGIRAAGTAYLAQLTRLMPLMRSAPNVMADPGFRIGLRHLRELGLSCDIFMFEPQLLELVSLAEAYPEIPFVLNHLGMPIGLGAYANTHAERFSIWRANLQAVARCPNIVLKVGGLGNAMCGFPPLGDPDIVGSEALAAQWRPYVETGIEAFGAERCMFESNFPVDGVTARYPIVWNAFKRIVGGASDQEKANLFFDTAARVYRIDLGGGYAQENISINREITQKASGDE